jgi:hypothetical protein
MLPQRRVVIVGDEQVDVDLLQAEFTAAKSDFCFEVLKVPGMQEARRQLESQPIHVLCVDLNLKSEKTTLADDGIDGIASFHRFKSPYTLIVVYSSFMELDRVKTTVRAMKAGASMVFETRDGFEREIVEFCVRELKSRTTLGGLDIEDWFETELPRLVREFGGQAVALADRQVVASASSVAELRRRLAQSPPKDKVTILLVPDQVLAP